MGKGDMRSKRGKIVRGTYGKSRAKSPQQRKNKEARKKQ